MGQAAKGFVIGSIVGQDRPAGIYIGGSTRALSQIGQRHLLTIEIVLRIGKHVGKAEHQVWHSKVWHPDDGTPMMAPGAAAFPAEERWELRPASRRRGGDAGRANAV